MYGLYRYVWFLSCVLQAIIVPISGIEGRSWEAYTLVFGSLDETVGMFTAVRAPLFRYGNESQARESEPSMVAEEDPSILV